MSAPCWRVHGAASLLIAMVLAFHFVRRRLPLGKSCDRSILAGRGACPPAFLSTSTLTRAPPPVYPPDRGKVLAGNWGISNGRSEIGLRAIPLDSG